MAVARMQPRNNSRKVSYDKTRRRGRGQNVFHWMTPTALGFWGSMTMIIALAAVGDLFLVTVPAHAMTRGRRVLTEPTRALM